MEQLQAVLRDDDDHTGDPGMLHFTRVANMVAVACRLGDISDMLDLKTNEKPQEVRRLLHITLE